MAPMFTANGGTVSYMLTCISKYGHVSDHLITRSRAQSAISVIRLSGVRVILRVPLARPPAFMSSTNTSSTNFQSILHAALDSYARQTGIDIMNHPSADKLQSCASSEHILQLLQDRETEFKDYRDKHRKLISCLRPVVQVVHAFSGALAEVAGLVSDPVLSDFILTPMPIPPGAFPTDKSNYYWGRCSTCSKYLPYIIHRGNRDKYSVIRRPMA